MKKVFIFPMLAIFCFLLVACNNTDNSQGLIDQNQGTGEGDFTPNQVSFGPDDQQQDHQSGNTGRYNVPVPVNPGREQNIFTNPAPEQRQNTGMTSNNQGIREVPDQQDDNRQSTTMSDFQSEVVTLTNRERERNGLSALETDTDLMRAAQIKSDDMATNNYFSHTSPTYGSPFDMLQELGIQYTTAAENIASGQPTAEEVVIRWMDSPGHRKNILNQDITHIGVGFSEHGNFWTQLFIKK